MGEAIFSKLASLIDASFLQIDFMNEIEVKVKNNLIKSL
jgi:hypothetical protein